MDDTTVTQEQMPVGPALLLLPQEKRDEMMAQAEAKVLAEQQAELLKTQFHQLKHQKTTADRRARKTAGLAKRENERLNDIRKMWPTLDKGQRQKTIERYNYMTPAMKALFVELQTGDLDVAEIPSSVPSLVIASEAELREELKRREQHATDAQTPASPSAPATQQTVEDQDEDNALEDTEPRKRNSRRPAKAEA